MLIPLHKLTHRPLCEDCGEQITQPGFSLAQYADWPSATTPPQDGIRWCLWCGAGFRDAAPAGEDSDAG